MHLVVAILKNGRHFEFWNFFRWLTGFIKRVISKEYVCQFWCLFPEMKDSFTYLPHYSFSGETRGGFWVMLVLLNYMMTTSEPSLVLLSFSFMAGSVTVKNRTSLHPRVCQSCCSSLETIQIGLLSLSGHRIVR